MKYIVFMFFVDNEFNSVIDKSKRYLYGGYGDRIFFEFLYLLYRFQSVESQLDSCNSLL